MLKKVICLFLACCMLTTYAYANENTADSKTTYTLSLEDAINLALKNNPELEVCDIKLSSLNVSLDAARLTKRSAKNATISVSSGLATAYVKDGYYVDVYESQIRLNKLEREQIKSKIAYNVTEKYYNYKLMESLVAVTEQSYTLALDNKNAADERFSLGMISQLEVDNADVALKQSELARDNYKRNLEIAKEDLKITLQLDGEECNLNLTDDIEYKDFSSDVTADTASAMTTRYDVNALSEADALAKSYFDITAKYSAENTATYNTAKSDYIQANYNKTNNTKLIALSIKSDYNNILATKGELEIAQKNLEIKKLEFRAASLRHEMGMITNMQLTSVLNSLAQQEITTENAKLAYKLAVEKYQYDITIGL